MGGIKKLQNWRPLWVRTGVFFGADTLLARRMTSVNSTFMMTLRGWVIELILIKLEKRCVHV